MSTIQILGARVLLNGELSVANVTISEGMIRSTNDTLVSRATTIDGRGLTLSPGFLDLQINGAYGLDLATDPRSMWELGSKLVRHGVTAFLPTIISSPANVIDSALEALDHKPAGYLGAEPLGLHLEGPMLNPQRPGAHPPAHLVGADLGVIDGWSRQAGVTLVTMAPELPVATTVIAELVRRGVTVAAGHSNATASEAADGIQAGTTMVTHLFNAMAPMGHREPNLAGVALAESRLRVSLIADGVHVDPIIIATIWKAKGAAGLALVTDAVAPMGLGPGRYEFADTAIIADDRSVRTDHGVLAGSILTLDQAVRNLIAFTSCDLSEALATVTTTPSAIVNETGRGRIEPGARADLVLVDPKLNIQITICAGQLAYIADCARSRIATHDPIPDSAWKSS
ncbi:MAG: N-acetylglucosamine-6-phosphate deacetylase [Actinomycetia bacterium]|nr:N-acetylglucosamine-6-phosphate deacetylase [Actinomycetes bacterium]